MIRITAAPLPTMTIDALRTLKRDLDIFEASVDPAGLPDRMTVVSDERKIYETADLLADADVTLEDVTMDGHRSFRSVFNNRLPIDTERISVYVTMCREGRI